MKKIIYIVLDGLGDAPVKELDNKTPLEAAHTPNMDSLARKGRTGLLYPVAKNIAPESDVAVLALLGYDAQKYYTGRGPIEAFAEGLSIDEGSLALRFNFATVEPDGKTIKDRRVGRDLTREEASALVKEINSKVALSSATFELKSTVGHRGVLLLKGMLSRLSGWITNTDPAYARLGLWGMAKETFIGVVEESVPMPGHEHSIPDKETAFVVNEFTRKAHKVLSESVINRKRSAENKLPANILLVRDAGRDIPDCPTLENKYNVKFGCFVDMPVEKGIALLTGMDIIEVPSATGHLEVDYSIRAKIACESVKSYDGIYVHIKGLDEPGHDGDFRRKKEIIEMIDRYFFSNLIPAISLDGHIICVTADHATVCSKMAHSPEAVPLLIAGGMIKSDSTRSFSEKAAKRGSLGELTGIGLLPLLIKLVKE
ncbi:MAG: alkaline phosphatase family protein [Candidatus Omnitrophica bacterium]|nr:alkaline phosphatase family protein [Candidatus Omnitrophota bacterium]